MSKDEKSMDEVLSSIRKIIRTDPTLAPPDISSAPGGVIGDETARDVLDKLRRSSGEAEEREQGKPLSASEDPDEAARAVLDHLRRQAEAEAKGELARAPEPAAEEPEPALEPTPEEEPPAVAADEVNVPELEEEPPAGAADEGDVPEVEEEASAAGTAEPAEQARAPKGGRRRLAPLEPGAEAGTAEAAEQTRAPKGEKRREAPLELGAEGRVMEPKRPPAPEPELPQPAARAEPAERDDRDDRDTPVMVDEAALEAMIRRVVRDELMGEMGRRVTQNVVKLIREEVARSRLEDK